MVGKVKPEVIEYLIRINQDYFIQSQTALVYLKIPKLLHSVS